MNGCPLVSPRCVRFDPSRLRDKYLQTTVVEVCYLVDDLKYVAAKKKTSFQRAADVQPTTMHRRKAQVIAMCSSCFVCGQAPIVHRSGASLISLQCREWFCIFLVAMRLVDDRRTVASTLFFMSPPAGCCRCLASSLTRNKFREGPLLSRRICTSSKKMTNVKYALHMFL